VRLLELISQEQFCKVESRILGDQVLVRGNGGDPGRAGGEFIVEHQLSRSVPQTLGATERSHQNEEFLVYDSVRRGRSGDGRRLAETGREAARWVDFGAHFVGRPVEHVILAQSAAGNQE